MADDCEVCGYGHRYQFPDGSDASHHKATAVACANSVIHDIGVMLAKDDPDAASFVRQRIETAITRMAINLRRPTQETDPG